MADETDSTADALDTHTVRRSYDELAPVYAARRSEADRSLDFLRAFIEPLSSSARVLDAGCGGGTPVLSRLSSIARAVGLDFSREQLRLARHNAPGAALVEADMTSTPFEDDTFDAIVAYWSLIHVPIDDHARTIEEFARILRPGGRLLVSIPVDRRTVNIPRHRIRTDDRTARPDTH